MSTVLKLPGKPFRAAETACGCSLATAAEEPAVEESAADVSPVDVPEGRWGVWFGPVVFENEITGDSRKIGDGADLADGGALRWEEQIGPLSWAPEDFGGHAGSRVVGRIDSLERRDDGSIWGTGPIDLGSEIGREAYRQVAAGLTPGVSVDLDDVTYEVKARAEVLDAEAELIETLWDDEASEEDVQEAVDAYNEVQGLDDETDGDGYRTVAVVRPEDQIMVITSGRIRGATMVAIPAFAGARISVRPATDEEQAGFDAVAQAEEVAALAAAGFPVAPPREWFSDPHLDGPTPLTVTDDGRVYGHAAIWGTCHTGWANRCVQPPHDPSGYASFLLGALRCADGTDVAVGHITIDTRHANLRMSAAAASRHYDDTGTTAADVTVGEDTWGIWFSGALRPNLTPAQVRTLRASPLSGDWRQVGTGLRLMAMLGVNMPGFPVPRVSGALAASGEPVSLVAAGMLAPRRVLRPGTEGAFDSESLAYLQRLARKGLEFEAREREAQARSLRARLNLAANTAKVAAYVGAVA